MLVQKITKSYAPLDMAIAYYSVIFALNGLSMAETPIRLVAFMAIRGSITNPAAKKDFCETFSCSSDYLNNVIGKLRKKGVLVKEKGKIRINPVIAIDFTSTVYLQIKLAHADRG